MNILIFKTNIADSKQVKYVSPHLKSLNGIIKWTVDLHDCDKVLRIEANKLSPHSVESLLANAGYYCEELQD